jgi:hypothetical protein
MQRQSMKPTAYSKETPLSSSGIVARLTNSDLEKVSPLIDMISRGPGLGGFWSGRSICNEIYDNEIRSQSDNQVETTPRGMAFIPMTP